MTKLKLFSRFKTERLDIDEKFGVYYLRELTAGQRRRIEAESLHVQALAKKVDTDNADQVDRALSAVAEFEALYTLYGLIDENKERVFPDEGSLKEIVDNIPQSMLTHIAERVRELSGMTREAVDDLKKNTPPTAGKD